MPKNGKPKLLYEGVLIAGESGFNVACGIAWRILDNDTANALGLFRWGKADDHQGSAYEPHKG